MRVKVKNLGALVQAEFSLGNFTIICGGNNMGKTYATYALFGFLHTWHEVMSIDVADHIVKDLFDDGAVSIDLSDYVKNAENILASACQVYTKKLPDVFSAQKEMFKDSSFELFIANEKLTLDRSFERKIRAANTELFVLTKDENSEMLLVSLLVDKENVQLPSGMIRQVISNVISEIIFSEQLPSPFIASAERTGAAIFRNELNFARNRLLEELRQSNKNVNPIELLMKSSNDYALAVEENVDFTRQLENISKNTSQIAEEAPDILKNFADIIGGDYEVTRNDELYFKPKGSKVKLTMDASSSAVRSLLDIGFYLRHVAKRGDLLMVDEPELNLHPENQRRVARLFARLVHFGIKIFITTHSDYITKELNTLVMLNSDQAYLKEIAQEEGYLPEEFMSADKIRVYIAEIQLIHVDGMKKRVSRPTLVSAKIDPDMGIEARSFDETIETMNRIQEAIVWGQ